MIAAALSLGKHLHRLVLRAPCCGRSTQAPVGGLQVRGDGACQQLGLDLDCGDTK